MACQCWLDFERSHPTEDPGHRRAFPNLYVIQPRDICELTTRFPSWFLGHSPPSVEWTALIQKPILLCLSTSGRRRWSRRRGFGYCASFQRSCGGQRRRHDVISPCGRRSVDVWKTLDSSSLAGRICSESLRGLHYSIMHLPYQSCLWIVDACCEDASVMLYKWDFVRHDTHDGNH
jgi:hypothetical protein